jgi:GT2 family glycosyltransferase
VEKRLVSVIIPAYRADKYIGATLEGVRRQSNRSWEVVVVEDGSSGATEGLVEQFAASVPGRRVVYLRHCFNERLGPARNTAIRHARGEYLAFLDADDVWLESHLASHVAALDSSGAGLAYSTPVLYEDGTEVLLGVWGPTHDELRYFPNALFHRNFITPSAVVLRRRVCDEVGPFDADPSIHGCEDLDYWLRCVSAGVKFTYVTGCHCLYRKGHAAAMTSNAVRITENLLNVLLRHYGMGAIPLDVQRSGLAANFERLGAQCMDHSAMRALRQFCKAWVVHPNRRNLSRLVAAVAAMAWRRGRQTLRAALGRAPVPGITPVPTPPPMSNHLARRGDAAELAVVRSFGDGANKATRVADVRPLFPDVSVAVTVGAEEPLTNRAMRSVWRAAAHAREHGIWCEMIVIRRRPGGPTRMYFAGRRADCDVYEIDIDDPRGTRSIVAQAASGKYVAFLNSTDLISHEWLLRACQESELDPAPVALHPQYVVGFGQETRSKQSPSSSVRGLHVLGLPEATPWEPPLFLPAEFVWRRHPRAFAGEQGCHDAGRGRRAEPLATDLPVRTVDRTCVFIRLGEQADGAQGAALPRPCTLFEPNVPTAPVAVEQVPSSPSLAAAHSCPPAIVEARGAASDPWACRPKRRGLVAGSLGLPKAVYSLYYARLRRVAGAAGRFIIPRRIRQQIRFLRTTPGPKPRPDHPQWLLDEWRSACATEPPVLPDKHLVDSAPRTPAVPPLGRDAA